jgi:uracil-DNA glycosylase
MRDAFDRLFAEIRSCTLCAAHLPLGTRPLVRGRPAARLLIISQAPGKRAHSSGLSFDDRSGDRLRDWLALDRTAFYDETRVAIMPIGFCYPGRAPGGGDLPPRRECAPHWHEALRRRLPAVALTLLVGSHAIRYYLPQTRAWPIGEAIARWREFLPEFFPLPHPSWRVTSWLRRHPWFAAEALPELRAGIAVILDPPLRSAPCRDR